MITYKPLKRHQHGRWVDSGELGLEITEPEMFSDDIEEGAIVAVRDDCGQVKHEMIGRIICRKDDFLLCTIDEQGFDRPNYSEIAYREGRCGKD